MIVEIDQVYYVLLFDVCSSTTVWNSCCCKDIDVLMCLQAIRMIAYWQYVNMHVLNVVIACRFLACCMPTGTGDLYLYYHIICMIAIIVYSSCVVSVRNHLTIIFAL